MAHKLIVISALRFFFISVVSTNLCKTDIKNTTEMCVFCKKNTFPHISEYFKPNETRKGVTLSNIMASCRPYGWYHNFYDRAPNEYRFSILPPSTKSDWCYFDIFYKNESQSNHEEERLYLSPKDTCSNSSKWALEKEYQEDRTPKALFRYRIKGNKTGKRNNA